MIDVSENRIEGFKEFQKSQFIRLIDVFVIAPICIYAGLKTKDLPKSVSISLILIGLTTFYYNGKNYLINKDRKSIDL